MFLGGSDELNGSKLVPEPTCQNWGVQGDCPGVDLPSLFKTRDDVAYKSALAAL